MHVSYFHIQCVAAVQVCRVAPTGEWGGATGAVCPRPLYEGASKQCLTRSNKHDHSHPTPASLRAVLLISSQPGLLLHIYAADANFRLW